MKKINIYKIVSLVALIVLLFILILPQKYNVNKKQKAEECIKNMSTIYKAINAYMVEREENFIGTAQDLMRMNYLKKTFECPENGVGDKYFMEGDFETGEITVTCPHAEKFPDHVLPESILD
jgi:competence protein ComGC